MAVVAADDSTGFCSCSGAAHYAFFDVSRSEILMIGGFVSQPL